VSAALSADARWRPDDGEPDAGEVVIRGCPPDGARRRIVSSDDELRLLRIRLHDTTLQTLEFIANAGTMGHDADVERLMRLAAREATELRHLIEGLTRPDPLSLSASLADLVDRTEAYGDERIELVVGAADDSVERFASLELAAAAGEAITNARKHAAATRIVVYLEERRGGALITVKDDGRGADLSALRPRLGLSVSIKSRITRLGGKAELASAPGNGFLVRLMLPPAAGRAASA
jgi:signal transduction histidine kinase